MTHTPEGTHILYAMPASYYSARVRAYLRKAGIPFEERTPGDPRFMAEIVPVVGRWIIPVVVTPRGEVLQDGADILDHFEREAPAEQALLPQSAALRLVSHLVPLFGGEGLLKAAMHYRWNFADNLAFLRQDFTASLSAPGLPDDGIFDGAARRMRKAALFLGATAESAATVEITYRAFLDAFDRHLALSPYVLGDRPTLADYGLIGPLHAHLGRDPVPSTMMKALAPRVFRWTERMMAPESGCGEYAEAGSARGDDLPESLVTLLESLATLFTDEMAAHVEAVRAWLAEHPHLADGAELADKPGSRSLGDATYHWCGIKMRVAVMPYRLYLLQRIFDCLDAATPSEHETMIALLARIGFAALPDWRLPRRVGRRRYCEVVLMD